MSELTKKINHLELYARLYEEYGTKDAREYLKRLEEQADKTLEAIRSLPVDEQLSAAEPNSYEAILAERPDVPSRTLVKIDPKIYREKVEGALLCRFAGCTLGAIVEGWSVERMEKWAGHCGDAFPPVDYWSQAYVPEDTRLYKVNPQKDYTKDGVRGVPVDDDITYTLLGLLIAERFGVDFTVDEVAQAWLNWLPVACTAEDIALQNIKKGIPAKQAADINNPFCQWIGADIRSDPWGYIGAGNPEKAAAMAYQDAYLTHRRNGIYGEMFLAAAQAAAFVCDTAEEALRVGLGEIPKNCLLAKDIRWALDCAGTVKDWREARRLVDERFEGMSPVHTNNNMCLMIFGLLLGGGDITKVLGEIVAMGMDNDCTAASAGSIIGAIVGAQGVPAHWTRNFDNRVYSYLMDHPIFHIDDVVERFARLNALI